MRKKYLGAVVQGISKGVVVESLLSSMVQTGKPPDFVLCIGDDRSDEDMFESIVCPSNSSVKLPASSEVFACTVGKKPSMAKYYLDDTVDVIKMLDGLASAPTQRPRPAVQLRVSFEGSL
jgi:trehalose 6-phosphate synthase/phosphatase